MTARSSMTLRCTVERDATATDNAWNNPDTPDWQTHIASLSCWTWTENKREQAADGRYVVTQQERMMIPAGTDVTEKDRINGVVDRAGTTIISGVFNILAVIREPTHLELVLQKES